MSDGYEGHPRWRVLVDGDLVAADSDQTIAALDADAVAGTFPVAPELLLELDGKSVVLDVHRPGEALGGRWLPLAEVAGPPVVVDAVRSAARSFEGDEPLPPRRQEWFARPWLAEVDTWIDQVLASHGRRRTGASAPMKVWSLSAVLRIPTDHGPVLLKATCEHFRSEPRITDLLGRLLPGRVPALLGHQPDRGWQLMAPLEGVSDEDDPTPGLAAPTAAAIAGMQLACVPRVAELRAAGCPERGLETSLAAFRDVVAGSPELRSLDAEQLAAVRRCLPTVERQLADLASYDVPATLVHGDLHLGNVAHHDDVLAVFDWSDASVGHPFVDAVTLRKSSPPDEREALVAAYLAPWRDAQHGLPATDLDRAMELSEVAEDVFQVVTYDRLQAAQEEAAAWVFDRIVARKLLRMAQSRAD